MNKTLFKKLLNKLGDSSWQQVFNGQSIIMIDDQLLKTGEENNPAAIIKSSPETETAEQLKLETIHNAEDILNNYYLSHPLTQAGFNHQTELLVKVKGALSFAAPAGKFPAYTLFVEGGEVIAEAPDSPRFRYGAFCELDKPVVDNGIDSLVEKWIKQGDAYNLYLNMNVCRYNC